MRILLLLFFVIAAGAAWSEPVEWPVSEGGNGHFYEVISGLGSPGLTWDEADEMAKSKSHLGLQGHLVTLTSPAEKIFVGSLPEVYCDLPEYTWCLIFHVGGWSIVTEVLEPRPYNPPYVETTVEQWITGETGTVEFVTDSFVQGPKDQIVRFKWGTFSMDGFGLPDYGTFATVDESTAQALVVEYDDLSPYHYPDGSVQTTSSVWGSFKAIFR